MKTLIIMLSVLATAGACQVQGSITGDEPDGPPIKLPPEGKPGGDTATACGGVTERGQCQDGVALHCDVIENTLSQVDCAALGQECVIDPDRGAKCVQLNLAEPTDPDAACDGQIDGKGFCADGQAVWCDGQSDQIYAWNCAQSGLACAVDECQEGAYCCEAGAPPPDPEQPSECDTLGFAGECAGEVARWCTGSDTLIELDCAARGQVCAFDVCAEGAYCCNPPEEINPCPDLGVYGECGGADGNTMRYCLGENLYETQCQTGESCMLDVCFDGADCCSQAEYDAACTNMGVNGFCGGPDDNTAVWCDNAEILRNDCAAVGKTCQIDMCGPGAWCC